MKKISIIVPVYNSEKYVEKCIDSIIAQKYENKEIIVINDGSTDKTEEKIKKYIDKIKYIKKENTGVADTRNLGIKEATGDYIMFVDADDYIDENLLESIKPYIENNVEMIKYKAIEVNLSNEEKNSNCENCKQNSNQNETKLEGVSFGVTTGAEAFSKMCFKDVLIDIPWMYLYKKELFENKEFIKGLYHEDFGLIPLIIVQAKTFVSTDIYGYYYVQSDNSITRNEDYEKTKKKVYDLLIHYVIIYQNQTNKMF